MSSGRRWLTSRRRRRVCVARATEPNVNAIPGSAMSNRIAGRALALACLIVAVTACPASAQLGRLGGAVKKQVKEAAGLGNGSSADAAAPSSASSGPRFGDVRAGDDAAGAGQGGVGGAGGDGGGAAVGTDAR
jgi:hypothetical protein